MPAVEPGLAARRKEHGKISDALHMKRKVGLGVLTPPPDLLDDHRKSRRGEDTAPYPPRAAHGSNARPMVGGGCYT